jgi:hypothetical protein
MRLLLLAFLAACSQPVVYRPVAIVRTCESRAVRPAIACTSGELGYDGCRWGCTLEPVEMEIPEWRVVFDVCKAKG